MNYVIHPLYTIGRRVLCHLFIELQTHLLHNVYNTSLSIKNDIEEVSMMVDELKDDFLPPSSFSNSPFLERMIPVQLSYERINYKDSKDMKVIDFQL